MDQEVKIDGAFTFLPIAFAVTSARLLIRQRRLPIPATNIEWIRERTTKAGTARTATTATRH